MASSSWSVSPLICNLCWDVLEEPYIVTSCNHAFCRKHSEDERIKQSTCPGCGQHLPSKGGLHLAHYRISKDEASSLNGLQPESILLLMSNALQFWISQERTIAEYHKHQARQNERRKEEQKEQFRQMHAEMVAELNALRHNKGDQEGREEELKQELTLLQQKYQEETHKVRMLQEKMIDAKRKRVSSNPQSPSHAGGTGSSTPERSLYAGGGRGGGSGFGSAPPRSPMRLAHGGDSGAHGMCGSGLAGPRLGSSLPHNSNSFAPLSSPAPHRGGALAGGGLGGGSGLGGGGQRAQPPRLTSSFSSLMTPSTSRHSTPVHRSNGLTPLSLPPLGSGLGAGGWSGRR